MAKKRQQKKLPQTVEELQSTLPSGVKLIRTLTCHQGVLYGAAFDPRGQTLATGGGDKTVKLWRAQTGKLLRILKGHSASVKRLAFDPLGGTLASASDDSTVKLWEVQTGKLLRTLEGHSDGVRSVAFDARGETLATGSGDKTVKLWEAQTGKLLHTLEGHSEGVWSVAFDPYGGGLASASADKTVKLWEAQTGKLVHTLAGHLGGVWSVAFDPHGGTLGSASHDKTVKLWDPVSGRLLRTLEEHTESVRVVSFHSREPLLASRSWDSTIRVWSSVTWEVIAVIRERANAAIVDLPFHPVLPHLATAGAYSPDAALADADRLLRLYSLDLDSLLAKTSVTRPVSRAVHHTTAKIVLVGDHSVGKSALGYRLIHGHFEKQESTHGQQFWVFPALGKQRADGTECEAILWDFAGQPDYRLVHALFVDNADLALVLFDASDLRDPLHGVGFWLKQLQTAQSTCPIILVAAQTDRGSCSLTEDELKAFCQKHGIVGPITTSAATGVGIDELVERMKALIPWDDKPATVTTTTFKRIKDYLLGLKEEKLNEERPDTQTIVTPEELRARLEATDDKWQFTDAEMMTAVGHLENYGYVKRLRTSNGELRILLQPERLNNLASSFVLKARSNQKGLGALEEKRLLSGGYDFPELRDLNAGERDVLFDSAALLFLEHNVCFRETDPLRVEPYLVFPELINLKKPLDDDAATEDGVAYTVTGPTENVFASLVVLLGYTHTFTRTAQWHNNARYEVGDGLVCGFRQDGERDGELDFVLCFAPNVGSAVRTLFQGLFESFLGRRNLTVMRYEPVRCSKNHLLNRDVVREALQHGDTTAFCSKCGEELKLPAMAEPIQFTREVQAEVDSQRRAAEQRTRFEQAVFSVRAFVAGQERKPPECFISYAWGVAKDERWVEKRLVPDLQKAGLQIVFDRKDNQHGDSLTGFISRIPYCDSVVVVGTPLYFQKFENKLSSAGSVVAAEVKLISQRLIGTPDEHRTVKPVLLAGEKKTSLPPLLWDGIHADFRDESAYFLTAFDLILSLYELPRVHSAVADLRESLREPEFR